MKLPAIMSDVACRLREHWRMKFFLGNGLTIGFWVLYLAIEWHPIRPITPVPILAADRLIPFMPDAVYPYESLWLLMPVAPWLMTKQEDLNAYFRAMSSIILIGLVTFLLYPTSGPRPVAPGAANGLYLGLVRVDSALNAFPSLHAAFAVFSALCCQPVLASMGDRGLLRAFMWFWVLAILAATLLTKQHVVLDLVGGSLLGAAGYLYKCVRAERMLGRTSRPQRPI